MKTFALTLTTFLFIGLIIPNVINAQTHRLLSKIEETKLGNNVWDKVTVMLPNTSYALNKVTYQNNTLLVLFDYTKTTGDKPTYFTFNLSDYKINCRQISEQASFQVVAKPKNSILKNSNWVLNGIQNKTSDPPISTFRCPVYCPF